MSVSKANAKATSTSVPTKPIDIFQTQYSLIYANVHPVLLLSLLLFNFGALVQDPVSALTKSIVGTALLQAIYCVVCLPSTGQSTAKSGSKGQKKKGAKASQDIWSKLVVWAFPSHL